MNHNQSKKSKQGKQTPKTNKSFSRPGPKRAPGRPQRRQASLPGLGRPNQLGGFGAMRSAPVTMSRQFKTGRPNMQSMRNGDCRIVHREYIADIIAAATGANFNNTQYPINPGQSSVFQWLSKIAQNFESYHFRKLKFDYETEAPSSLGGTLVLAVDYDASDAAPTTKQQMLAFRGSVRSAPWTPCQHNSLGEDLSKLKSNYVRSGNLPPLTDVKFYDIGVLNVATQGISTNSATCGELYVEYDVDLMTPLYEPIQNASTYQALTALTAAEPLGTSGNLLGGLSAVVGNNGTNSTLTLNNLVIGSEMSISIITTGTAITGAVEVQSLTGGTLKTSLGIFPAAATSSASIQTITVTATTIVCVIYGTAATITGCDVVISAIPTALF